MYDFERPSVLPVLALRGLCVFPNMLTHFDVGRKKSARAVEEAMREDQRIFLVAQKDAQKDDPARSDLYEVGTVAVIRQVLRLPGSNMRILVEGVTRARLLDVVHTEPYLFARVIALPEQPANENLPKTQALMRQTLAQLDQFVDLAAKNLSDAMPDLYENTRPGYLADFVGQNASFSYQEKQKLLEQLHPVRRLEQASVYLAKELDILNLENEISEKVQQRVDKNQREYYLREQLHAIHEELGDGDADETGDDYSRRIRALKLPEETEEKLLGECRRLSKQPSTSPEAALLRNYLDFVLELPWNKRTQERLNVRAAARILDADHFGLDKVKQRILETLAVRQLAPELPGQILCLVGPPGVGKTSIALSIAHALRRNYARISLGGVHDEAEIRGHRKTYIGAMPGRILSGIAQAKSKNALLVLDEVDKLGGDYRGDPASALLEVLDAEQNATFHDHYLEVPFDLHECMFIATANTLDTVPRALLDRMEVIELGSYTDEEKLQIAKRHLLPKQLARHGIPKGVVHLSDDAIREIITCYTRESGVRNLERELAAVCRKCAMRLVEDDAPKRIRINGANLDQLLGPRKFLPDELPAGDTVGLVTGLAWTAVGGETLEVEVNVVDGTGKLELTGNLGDVMKESVYAAMSYIRSRTAQYHLSPDFYKTKDIHVHFPEGAIPKDGPSAGITVCTAIVSALTGAPVRRDVAMTGEISIRGRVLPIGGLREKTMAALRHGVHTVIIPAANEKDLAEIDPTVRQALNFIPVRHVDTVIETALDLSVLPAAQPEDKPEAPAFIPPKKPSRQKPGIRQ